MNIAILQVTDSFGTTESAVVIDTCSSVFFSCLKNKAGEPISFESEAYHLGSWCDHEGLTLKTHRLVLDLDAKLALEWSLD